MIVFESIYSTKVKNYFKDVDDCLFCFYFHHNAAGSLPLAVAGFGANSGIKSCHAADGKKSGMEAGGRHNKDRRRGEAR
jgi:hypothetical protein